MSVDKLVDSTLLDAACTYEAGKIREKLGSSAQIAYDLANGKGFGDAIAAIPTGGGSLKYDVGDFTLASDATALATSNGISHNLGEVPGCVIIWQSTYTDTNMPTVQVNSGYVYLDRIIDMKQRLSSSASSADSFYAQLTCAANSTTGTSFSGPTSASYMPTTDYKPTAAKFGLPSTSSNNRWRAGVQYHYFVAEAWWQ